MKSIIVFSFVFLGFILPSLAQGPGWSVDNSNQYAYQMRVTVNVINGCGGDAPDGPYIVGAFINGEVRGVASGASTVFVTVFSDVPNGVTVSFGVYDESIGKELGLSASVPFFANSLGVTVSMGTSNRSNRDGDRFCDDEDPCPNSYNNNPLDSDRDGIGDECDSTPFGDPEYTCEGEHCDDGDPCTVNSVFDADCNCLDGVYSDSDNDGTCDGEDLCPNGDDTVDYDGDGIPDSCDDDPTCVSCVPDSEGVISICVIPRSASKMRTYRGDCSYLNSFFNEDGTFKNDKNHCGPCTCASMDDIDSDGDGVCDSIDECPANPNVQKTGNCSCDDEDDNGDGTADSCNRAVCSSSGNTEYEWIASITINEQTLSEQTNLGFHDYDKKYAIVTSKIDAIDFEVVPTCLDLDCLLSYALYADWNGDLDFEDEGELIARYRGGDIFKGEFMVLNNSVSNVRMRVIIDYGRIAGPCDLSIDGEVEDFILRFTENCEVLSDAFNYYANSDIVGQGDSVDWVSLWESSVNDGGVAMVLSESLIHNDLQSSGGKLGILNNSGTSSVLSRQIDLNGLTYVSFLFNRESGEGTFGFNMLGDAVRLLIDENGAVSLNETLAEENIGIDIVYRFLLELRYMSDGQISAYLSYSADAVVDSTMSIEIVVDGDLTKTDLIFTTHSTNTFRPVIHCLDELRISCSRNKIISANSFKNNSKKINVTKGNSKPLLSIHPNPSNQEYFYVDLQNQQSFNGKFELLNIDGKKVKKGLFIGRGARINTADLVPGLYIIAVHNNEQILQTKLFIQ